MKSILVFQPVMAHYRTDLFKQLQKSNRFEISFVAGKEYWKIKSTDEITHKKLDFIGVKLLGHTFYYLKGAVNIVKRTAPDIVISGGVDLHMVHILVVFFVQKYLLKNKFVWWTHATYGKQGRIGKAIRHFFYSRADLLLTYSGNGMAELIANGIEKDKVKHVGNALSFNDYGFLNKKINFNKKSAHLHIIFIGRLTHERRLDILFKAIRQIKVSGVNNVLCTIIGSGDNEDAYKKQTEDMCVHDLVKFVGAKYGQQTAEYFLDADLLVYPQSIGLAIAHSFSHGIPVITTNDMNNQMPEIELMVPGKTGDFYKDGNVEDLAEKILHWKEKIETEKATISEACINRVKEMGYLPDIMANKMLKKLEETFYDE